MSYGGCRRCEDSKLIYMGVCIGCFPNDALVITRNGTKRMEWLQIGDEVMTEYGFEEIYFSSHNISSEFSSKYVEIVDEVNRSITLTKDHFIRINGAYEYAENVKIGDRLTNGNKVSRVFMGVQKQGMHNPFTISGTIIVNNISASCHSSWFFEHTLSWFKPPTKYIPKIYQHALLFVRKIYQYHPDWIKRFLGDGEYGAQNDDLWIIIKKMYETF